MNSRQTIQVLDVSTDDPYLWAPEDPYDFEKLVVARIGDNQGGNYFHIRLVTPISIKHVKDKESIFLISKWEDFDSLKIELNEHIMKVLQKDDQDDPYLILSRDWQWEYAEYS